jgi:hypothetical protein
MRRFMLLGLLTVGCSSPMRPDATAERFQHESRFVRFQFIAVQSNDTDQALIRATDRSLVWVVQGDFMAKVTRTILTQWKQRTVRGEFVPVDGVSNLRLEILIEDSLAHLAQDGKQGVSVQIS